MKTTEVFFAVCCLTTAAWAQNSSPTTDQAPSGVISRGTNTTQHGGVSSMGGTNGAPGVDQLALQLQTLRTTVEQTLPMLREFNQQAGVSTNGLAGALSGLISGVFGKNTNGSSTAGSGQRLTNVLSALGALVSTNAQGSVSIDRSTLQNLATLEKDLQPVAEAMRGLNLGSTNQGITSPGGLTPTGR